MSEVSRMRPLSGARNSNSNKDQWAVPYSVLVTLVFALFVILYAMSQADLKKFQAAAASLDSALKADPAKKSTDVPIEAADAQDPFKGNEEKPEERLGVRAALSADPELTEIRSRLLAVAESDVDTSGLLSAELEPEGLRVRFQVREFFSEGEAEPHRDLIPMMNRVGKVLVAFPRPVKIEGHTDAGEGAKRGFELSSMRASWLARSWSEAAAFPPERLSISGFSYYRPFSLKGRSQTARLEILVPRRF